MMRKTKTTTIAIATALTTLLSTGAAFANTPSSNTVQAPKTAQTQACPTDGSFKSHLDSLVKSGTLTQEQEDTMQKGNSKDLDFKRGHNGNFKTVMDGLVKDGTITQAQEDTIKSKAETFFKSEVKTFMDGLVTDGTITQAQEDSIKSAMMETKEANTANGDLKGGHESEFETLMDGLVKDGTITQAQLDAIQSKTSVVAPAETPVVAPAETPVVTPAEIPDATTSSNHETQHSGNVTSDHMSHNMSGDHMNR